MLTSSKISTFLVAAFLLCIASFSHAGIYTEAPDAGSTPGTAQATVGTTGPLTGILGTAPTTTDVDVYSLIISSPSTFSATTNNTLTNASGLDTELFLFKTDGTPIAWNDDDASGLVLSSTLPTGNSLYSALTPGTYLLAIALDGNQPVNTSNQLVFAQNTGGGTTLVYGPASGLNPSVYSDFDDNVNFTDSGDYQIDLTGATASVVVTPEPSMLTTAVLIVGTFGRRRRMA